VIGYRQKVLGQKELRGTGICVLKHNYSKICEKLKIACTELLFSNQHICMHSATFLILKKDLFPKWKERHQVGSCILQMRSFFAI